MTTASAAWPSFPSRVSWDCGGRCFPPPLSWLFTLPLDLFPCMTFTTSSFLVDLFFSKAYPFPVSVFPANNIMHHCTNVIHLLYSPELMLTSRKLTGNPEAISQYHTKEENYYFSQAEGVEDILGKEGGHGHVRIFGSLAPELGHKPGQKISQEELTFLLAGKDRQGNKVSREHKVLGIDLTFSAPKSVSVAALLTKRDPRIVEAHDQAVLETMREIEAECGAAQPRPGVCDKTGNMAYVTVRDGFNRDHDPHLHTHVVVANLTKWRGKVLALDGREIMARDFNKAWGGLYRAKLAARLKELGYDITYTKKGEFRLDAVSLEVERVFSRRRAEIMAEKARGVRDMEAWRRTRKEKAPDVVKQDVVASWRSRLAEFKDKSALENREEAVQERDKWFREASWSVEARQELSGERETGEVGHWQVAARRATQTSGCVKEQALITEYLAELGRTEKWAGITYLEAKGRLQTQVQAGHILATDNGFYTTWEMARSDREAVAQRKTAVEIILPAHRAKRDIERYALKEKRAGRRGLSERQLDVAAAILSAEEATVVVQGDAGSGKTTMLKGVRAVAEGANLEILGIAIQGVAARKLEEESGIKSTTLAAYMAQERSAGFAKDSSGVTRLSRVLVIDEASMLGSRGLSELQAQAARHGDKLVLVGDRNQIQSVGAGKPFERLIEAAEASGSLLSLSENHRQRNKTLRMAVDMARQGHMRESFDLLDQSRYVTEVDDKVLRRSAIAKLYKEGTLIMAGTQESVEDLNRRIRESLVARGELARQGARKYEVSWEDADGIAHRSTREIAPGERIRFLKNEYRDYDVRNGECGKVVRTGRGELEVVLEGGREIKLALNRYSDIDYGYAVTTYKGQGQTFDRVIIEADTALPYLQDQRNSYVQITRARDEIHIFTDDKETLRDIAGVLSQKRDTLSLQETVVKARSMEQRLKDLARQEALAKGLAAPLIEPDFALGMVETLYREREPVVGPVRIDVGTLAAPYGDNRMMLEALRAASEPLEARINARADLERVTKSRLAAFFSDAEAAELVVLSGASADAKIAGVLMAMGVRQPHDELSGLDRSEARAIRECARLASEALERARERRGRELGPPGDHLEFSR